ncbi:MAG: four helix bundle protein [Rickettsiales bacterium]
MGSVESYRDLRIWQESIDLAKQIYALVDRLPAKELYGLRSQMTRSVVSIAANIAEGSRRRKTPDLIHFLSMAHGSLAELETHLTIGIAVGYFDEAACAQSFDAAQAISRGIKKLIQTLEVKA